MAAPGLSPSLDRSTLPTSRLAPATLRKFVFIGDLNVICSHSHQTFLVQGPSDKLKMSLKALTDDEKTELKEQFCVLDREESGFIQLNELKDALDLAGFKVPGWRVRDMIDKIDRETTNCPGAVVGQRKLSYNEFEHVSTEPGCVTEPETQLYFQLCCELKSKEVSQSFKQAVTKKDNIKTHGGMSQASADGE